VFCNEGVPGDDWNLYDELRNLLIERGMPRTAIRFIYEAGSDGRRKAALFAACNAGHVGVLIGSTEKMGVGTNVQRRCIGVHHVHPHWRPDYDAQEDARARRPGNLNAEVFIKKWITEGSFDTIRAQACERKSVFLHVIKHRDPSVRSIEAPGDDTVSYAEIAAVGAGEPRLIRKAQLESEVQQLARAHRRHLNNQNALKVAEQQARAAVTAAEQTIRDIDQAAGRVIPTVGDAFSMTVGGTRFTARREAGDHLITCLREARARVPAGECHTAAIGTIGGFQITADLAHDNRENTIVVRLAGLPGGVVNLSHRKLPAGIGLVTRLENRLTGLDELRLQQQAIIGRQRQEITRAQAAIGIPFPQHEALATARKALDDLVEELRSDTKPKAGDKPGSSPVPADRPASTQDEGSPSISPAAETPAARPVSGARTSTASSQAPAPVAESASADRGTSPHMPAAGEARPAGTTATSTEPGREQAAQASSPEGGAAQPAARPAPGASAEQASATAPSTPGSSAPVPNLAASQDKATMPEQADGLVIEHHQQGTLVRGTSKDDHVLRGLLRQQGFKWSGNLSAWYLPRPWNYSTRDRRVTSLTAGLNQAHRTFTMRRQQPADSHAAEHAPDPLPLSAASPTPEALEQRDAGQRAQATADGEALPEAAKDAFDAGDYPAALALIDQDETADPGHARWEQARAVNLEKSTEPRVPEQETAAQGGPAAGAGDFPPQHAAAEDPGAAGSRAAADTSPAAEDGAEAGEPSLLAVRPGAKRACGSSMTSRSATACAWRL
jgi:hypothetical protein